MCVGKDATKQQQKRGGVFIGSRVQEGLTKFDVTSRNGGIEEHLGGARSDRKHELKQ